MSVLHPHEMTVKNVNNETNPCAHSPRGLVYIGGSERRVLSYKDSPSPQTILEICVQVGGIPIYSLSIGAFSSATYFYEV